jgi:hypothetical protein
MERGKYSSVLIEQVLKDFEPTGDINLVSQKHSVPTDAIYRFSGDKIN